MKIRKKKIVMSKKERKQLFFFALILFLCFLLWFFQKELISLVVSFFLLVLGCFSHQFKRMFGANLGLEFITFATVLFLAAHGLLLATIACLFMILVNELFSKEFTLGSMAGFGSYLLALVICSFLPFSIQIMGIVFTILTNLFGMVFFLLLLLKRGPSHAVILFGNLIFNGVLFIFFAPTIASLL